MCLLLPSPTPLPLLLQYNLASLEQAIRPRCGRALVAVD